VRERHLSTLLDASDAGRAWTRIGELDAEVVLPLLAGAERSDPDKMLVMLDVGANGGQTSASMMRFICGGACSASLPCATGGPSGGPSALVLALEPSAAAQLELQGAALAGRWATCGWRMLGLAAADASGDVKLHGAGQQASLARAAAAGTLGTQAVRAVTVDALLEKHAPGREVFLLKIDAEGMDAAVLAGARGSIAARRVRFLTAEYNSK